MIDEKYIQKLNSFLPSLDEVHKRLYLASEAQYLGHGGISELSRATGISRVTITAGLKELEAGIDAEELSKKDGRIRREGAGRKPIEELQPGIKEALEGLMEGASFGDPMSLLRWTTKSLRNLELEMSHKGYDIKYRKIGYLLKDMGYSLQLNQKMNQVGNQHPDRDEQFRHINERAGTFISKGLPVISVDCKKKENLGEFANKGAEYSKAGSPIAVLDQDSQRKTEKNIVFTLLHLLMMQADSLLVLMFFITITL